MITEQQIDQATRSALGEMNPSEQRDFESAVRANPDLRSLLRSLQQTLDRLALSVPQEKPRSALKHSVMARISAGLPARAAALPAGLRFVTGGEGAWKPLAVPGAYVKLLSLQRDLGYAVLLGKLDPGVRYPAHINEGPEDLYLLTGDLHIGDHAMRPGDFHHADAGSQHEENYSIEGCTLLAVLSADHPLVQLAMG